jgi:SAM-dependent methyltransferase
MQPHHDHNHGDDVAQMFTQETWDARYAESDRLWSGRPNPRLVEHVGDLPPGDALDVGAGEGADAVWLARQGWRVTAIDVSVVALERVTAHAVEEGVGQSVSTHHHDLMTGKALPGSYDLVSAQYLHPPLDRFAEMFGLLGDAVRPGGRLLVVGHHPDDLQTGLRSGHGHPELLFTPEQVEAVLPGDTWSVEVAEPQTRPVDGPEGPVTVTDTVVLAVRR